MSGDKDFMCQASDGAKVTDGVAPEGGALQSGCGEEMVDIGYAAKIKKDQVLKYVIKPEAGLGFPARSLGRHILAITDLIDASAKDVGDAEVVSTICELSFENGEITIGFFLSHIIKGQFFDGKAADAKPD